MIIIKTDKLAVITDTHIDNPHMLKNFSKLLNVIVSLIEQDCQLFFAGDIFDYIKRPEMTVYKQVFFDTIKNTDAIFCFGNHDYSDDCLNMWINRGFRVCEYLSVKSGDKKILVCHGHQFDKWCKDPAGFWNAGVIKFQGWFDKAFKTDIREWLRGKFRKEEKTVEVERNAKTALKAGEFAAGKYDAVIIVHRHQPQHLVNDKIEFVDCGHWKKSDNSKTFCLIEDGEIRLIKA